MPRTLSDLSTVGQMAYLKKYVIDVANAGNKIPAIKNLRLVSPALGLKDAKDAVELLVGACRDLAAADAAYVEADNLHAEYYWRNDMRKQISSMMALAADNGYIELRDRLSAALDSLY